MPAYDDPPAPATVTPMAPPVPWAVLAWFVALLAFSYGRTLAAMAQEWITDDDMGHGIFVPVLAGWIVWQKRAELGQLPLRSNPWGLGLVLVGGLQLIAGTLGVEFFVARTAFLVSLAGIILYLGGWAWLRALAFPLFLLLFMIRIPAILYNQITFPLQLLASRVAETVLWGIGIPVLREGNILELATQRLSVVEACSGIRSLLSLSFLALIYAYMFDPKIWMRAVLLAATIPIAIAANAFRVTMTGVLSEYQRDLATGFFHLLEGWGVFMVALVILIVTHRLLNRLHRLYAARARS